MKKSIFSLAVMAAFATSILVVGCQSADKKVDKAETKVVDAQKDLKDAEAAAVAARQKAADEWTLFKAEAQAKINNNDLTIVSLREKMKTASKKLGIAYAKSIDELEAKNKALRTKIETYDTAQSDWEAFKREFNHDMDELGNALRDLTVNNKK